MNPSGLDQPRVSRVLVERYVARLRKRRRWRRLAVTVTVFLLILAGIGYYVGWHTRLFDVRATRVSGTRVLTPAQVVAAAAVPAHEPLAAVDVGAVRARVAAIPRVASVTVERDWFHTVRITVVERVPAAALPDVDPGAAAGALTVVDADGVPFDTIAGAHALPAHVPVIQYQPAPQGAAAGAPAPDPGKDRTAVITGALAALRALPPPVRARVQSVAATGPWGITLELASATSKGKPVTVVWGGGDRAELKARVLTILLKQDASHYDVSAPDAPAYS